MFMLCYEPMMY